MSLMLASCYIEESGSHLEIIKDEYALDDQTYWEGGIIYKIYFLNKIFNKSRRVFSRLYQVLFIPAYLSSMDLTRGTGCKVRRT